MEEKWSSMGTYGGGDNLQNEQKKRKSDSASSSSRCIHQTLESLMPSFSDSLDLSRKDLRHLTEDIYQLLNLKHLYLEGNVVSVIPEDFFQHLPNLVWLDLRYNKIKELPSGIGCHKQLKTLLLERNPIKRLPVEFGNLTSLTALNLRHCPLEFPPPEVVQKGLPIILCFLRKYINQNLDYSDPVSPEQEAKAIVREYKRKCDRPPDRRKAFNDLWKQMSFIKIPPIEKLNLTDVVKSSLDLSDDWPNEEEMIRFQKLREEMIQDEREEYLADQKLHNESMISMFSRKSKAQQSLSRKWSIASSRGKKKLFPAVSSYDLLIQTKKAEECRLAALKEMKEKQALIEQRRKDKEVLQKWRRQARLMRERKAVIYTFPSERGDMNAPYATSEDINYHGKLEGWGMTKRQEDSAEMMPNLSTEKPTEETRAVKYREVENRIRQLTHTMKERRKKLAGIPYEDMERANRDFQTAEELEAELGDLKKDLHPEYRFTAFTGELPAAPENPLSVTKPQNIFSNMTF
ncbi:leucine-rich repeat-containing protein 27 isoform X2 [Paroedura picta]|uniref:leucine-rich repeat-containing protein 27 isoform X2 n=1 Tax=Paroedura picta TaxID=143630 RepID=UPI00405657EE